MKNIIVKFMFFAGIAIGALGGHYHGKSEVYSRIIGEQIKCEIAMNPLTEKALSLK